MLINFQTTDQRLVNQAAVPQDTNEEAALAAHLPQMDLARVCLTTDAADLTKANCRQLTQNNGAEFFLFLKANQPTALAKAEQLLEDLMGLARGYWSIENGQHYRRDPTQDEDRCPVRHPVAARNLSLCRFLAVFLFQRQTTYERRRPCIT